MTVTKLYANKRIEMKNILITGGCGFIASNFIRYMLKNSDCRIINLDALTYAGNPENLAEIEDDGKAFFLTGSPEDDHDDDS